MKFAVALLLLLSVHLVSTTDCQDGWQVFQDNCYLFVLDNVTWHRGALEDLDVADYLATLVLPQQAADPGGKEVEIVKELWTSGYYLRVSGYWKWTGINERISGYFNWGVEQPKKPLHEYCLRLMSGADHKWIDGPCYDNISFACQKKVPTATGEFQGKNYTFHKIARTWKAAQAYCKKYQAHLPYVKNAEVQQWLAEQMDKHSMKQMWLGGNNLVKSSIWKWMPIKNRLSYSNWAVGKPKNPLTEHCLALWSSLDHKWTDSLCDSQIPFACQRLAIYQLGDYELNSYTLHREAKTWEKAQASCAQKQAHLAVVKNEVIGRWLGEQMDKYSVKELWIGGKYVSNDSYWEWMPSGERIISRFNWGIYEPSNKGIKNCLRLVPSADHKMNDRACDYKMSFLCQKSVDIQWEVFQGKNYSFHNEPLTRDDAKKTCKSHNSSLAAVSNVNINNWLGAHLKNRNVKAFWTGATLKCNPFLKDHDTKYLNWGDNSITSSYFLYCVEIRNETGFTWVVQDCLESNQFVCEKPI